MNWNSYGYVKKGAIIGGVVGLVGVLLTVFLVYVLGLDSMDLGPIFYLLVPFIVIGIMLLFSGIFGCDFKTDDCHLTVVFGFILTIAVFALIGMSIGWMVKKIKSK